MPRLLIALVLLGGCDAAPPPPAAAPPPATKKAAPPLAPPAPAKPVTLGIRVLAVATPDDPIAGVDLKVTGAGVERTVRSDASGRAQVELLPGRYTVGASLGKGCARVEVPAALESGREVELRLPVGCRISGTATGFGQKRLRVKAGSPTEVFEEHEVELDDAGGYTLRVERELPRLTLDVEGRYAITLAARGRPRIGRVLWTADVPPLVEGFVETSDGRPLADLPFEVLAHFNISHKSAPDGFVELGRLPPGTHEARCLTRGYAPYAQPLIVPSGTPRHLVRLRMKKAPYLSLKFLEKGSGGPAWATETIVRSKAQPGLSVKGVYLPSREVLFEDLSPLGTSELLLDVRSRTHANLFGRPVRPDTSETLELDLGGTLVVQTRLGRGVRAPDVPYTCVLSPSTDFPGQVACLPSRELAVREPWSKGASFDGLADGLYRLTFRAAGLPAPKPLEVAVLGGAITGVEFEVGKDAASGRLLHVAMPQAALGTEAVRRATAMAARLSAEGKPVLKAWAAVAAKSGNLQEASLRELERIATP
jgi:hypothetical protein